MDMVKLAELLLMGKPIKTATAKSNGGDINDPD